MDRVKRAAIDVVEATYDLEQPSGEWLPNLLRVTDAALGLDLGVYGQLFGGMAKDGQPLSKQVCAHRGFPDFLSRFVRAARDAGPEVIAASSQSLIGTVIVLSEWSKHWPEAADALHKNFDCADILAVFATDPDFRGAMIGGHSSRIIELSPKAREQWQMLGVHIAAGARLRQCLIDEGAYGVIPTELPMNAEALLDTTNFIIAQAVRSAQERSASQVIREAARRVDRARGKLRRTHPEEALELWQGLVRGRWSLVDWFDSDGRRFVLAKPNAPKIGDPRGLTEREHQVTTYAALGESNDIIAYRFGMSAPAVSESLQSAMRKLGVKTKPQLVEKLRGLPRLDFAKSHAKEEEAGPRDSPPRPPRA